jgi:hypothetical protein
MGLIIFKNASIWFLNGYTIWNRKTFNSKNWQLRWNIWSVSVSFIMLIFIFKMWKQSHSCSHHSSSSCHFHFRVSSFLNESLDVSICAFLHLLYLTLFFLCLPWLGLATMFVVFSRPFSTHLSFHYSFWYSVLVHSFNTMSYYLPLVNLSI